MPFFISYKIKSSLKYVFIVNYIEVDGFIDIVFRNEEVSNKLSGKLFSDRTFSITAMFS